MLIIPALAPFPTTRTLNANQLFAQTVNDDNGDNDDNDNDDNFDDDDDNDDNYNDDDDRRLYAIQL